MSQPELRELSPPPDAREQGGVEVLRVFVVEHALSVSLQRAFDDPATWGMLLGDVAQHVARIYGRESEITAEEALERIREALEAGVDRPDEDDGAPKH